MTKTRFLIGLLAVIVVALLVVMYTTPDILTDNGTPDDGTTSGALAEATSTPAPTAEIAARPTYVVQRGTVEDVFSFTGRWQPRDQLSLSFPINGTVRQVNVRPGDAVSAGDLLADYDVSSLENQLESARINLETAQSGVSSSATSGIESVENAEISLANARISLENTLNSSPWTNVASARVSLDNAQRSLEDAEQAYLEALSFPNQPASTVDNAYQQLLSAQSQVDSAEISYFSAAQNYNNYQYNIQQAENSVLQAEINLQRAIDAAAGGVSDENVRSTQLSIDQLEKDIAESSLYAPIDGVILEVSIAPGDTVAAYNTV
ncbi:MAG: biotin/lipoyl-binding protein, partial [Chloroflexi bacterium]|nr:biotin/lipoyl-binding protein [Chloroflexota bacterium]